MENICKFNYLSSFSSLIFFSSNRSSFSGAYNNNNVQNPYLHDIKGNKEDISWLL